MTQTGDTAPTWAERYTRTIADKVRTLRKQRGLSAQNLSDALATIGVPIHRSVLANWENGRRGNLDTTELLALAHVLAVPPIELLFPAIEPGETVEMLPGCHMDRRDASSWFNGTPADDAIDMACAGLAQAMESVQRAQSVLLAATRSARPAASQPRPRRRVRAVERAAAIDEAFAGLEQIADAGRSA